jgi:hypothetical protein
MHWSTWQWGIINQQVNFTHSQVANMAINYLSGELGMLDAVRDGIDRAIEHEQLILLDKEKGAFTSDIHLLNELSVAQLSRIHIDERGGDWRTKVMQVAYVMKAKP